ncbi:hypothetical protein AXG93_4347s1010 [Marchantia polymorpha subsp. ruderalis]|uniref:Uncharacterized protein n=1 Tax=Marchantia polymorpha subsp. ruderalis TaxID=1480154 RepID=A0A176WNR5_MARPO|nr:hypothetical protein AXG93_4347s1010 [Marchantia polymorpha subsp. ruderalis]
MSKLQISTRYASEDSSAELLACPLSWVTSANQTALSVKLHKSTECEQRLTSSLHNIPTFVVIAPDPNPCRGASIFSHAAELATREMDSAHEEPELPSAIQDLVQRLEGQGEPITELPDLTKPEFREFFPWSEAPSTIIGWRSQVRRRVLEAIGSCNTFEILDVGNICGGYISRLTPSEWEVVLRGFRSSTVLKKIIVYGLFSSDDADKESLCFQLGRILNSSSVTELKLSARLSARCLSNLASGLRGRSDSKLKSLDLLVAWEDSSAVKYVADMINSAPLLETLRLGGYWEDMEDETVGILSQALIQSLALKEFTLDYAGKWAGPLLLKALAGDDRNRSH